VTFTCLDSKAMCVTPGDYIIL